MYIALLRGSCAGCGLALLTVMIAFAQEENHAKENQKPVAAERDVREVLVIKQQYDEALLRGDSTWFEQAFAEDYLLILGDATTHTKGQIVKQLASRQVIWQRAAGRDMDVRMYGDTAIVTGRFSGKWTENGKPFTTEERFTSVWIKQGGRWKAVSEHASQVPTQ